MPNVENPDGRMSAAWKTHERTRPDVSPSSRKLADWIDKRTLRRAGARVYLGRPGNQERLVPLLDGLPRCRRAKQCVSCDSRW